MKKAILTIICTLILSTIYAQENFTWSEIGTVQKSKSQIYSDTKMFIAKYWKSAQDVIQNDDKEMGIILIKGSSIKKVKYSMNDFTYVYYYNVTFRMKENRYKITIDMVHCDEAYPIGPARFEIPKIEPFDGEYIKANFGWSGVTLPEKKALKMIAELKLEMQSIIDNYQIEIEIESSENDDW